MSRSSGRHRTPPRRGAHGTLSGAVLSSLSAPVGAALGIGSAVAGMLADRPVLGLLGVVVAAVPGVLQGMRASALDRGRARSRAAELAAPLADAPVAQTPPVEAPRAAVAAAVAEPAVVDPAPAPVVGLPPIASPTTSMLSLPLPDPVVERERSVWALPTERLSAVRVDLVKSARAAAVPVPAETAEAVAAEAVVVDLRKVERQLDVQPVNVQPVEVQPVSVPVDGRVDTAELQLIWDLEGRPALVEGDVVVDPSGTDEDVDLTAARAEPEPAMAGAPRALGALGSPGTQSRGTGQSTSVPAQGIRPTSRPLITPYARPAILPPTSTRQGRHASAAPSVVRRERPEVPVEDSPRRAARRRH